MTKWNRERRRLVPSDGAGPDPAVFESAGYGAPRGYCQAFDESCEIHERNSCLHIGTLAGGFGCAALDASIYVTAFIDMTTMPVSRT